MPLPDPHRGSGPGRCPAHTISLCRAPAPAPLPLPRQRCRRSSVVSGHPEPIRPQALLPSFPPTQHLPPTVTLVGRGPGQGQHGPFPGPEPSVHRRLSSEAHVARALTPASSRGAGQCPSRRKYLGRPSLHAELLAQGLGRPHTDSRHSASSTKGQLKQSCLFPKKTT